MDDRCFALFGLLAVSCLLLFTFVIGAALVVSGWCWFWICVVWVLLWFLFGLCSLLFCGLAVCWVGLSSSVLVVLCCKVGVQWCFGFVCLLCRVLVGYLVRVWFSYIGI